MGRLRFTILELTLLLLTNVLAFGVAAGLMTVRGPSGPMVLIAVGAAGMAIAKVGRAYMRSRQTV